MANGQGVKIHQIWHIFHHRNIHDYTDPESVQQNFLIQLNTKQDFLVKSFTDPTLLTVEYSSRYLLRFERNYIIAFKSKNVMNMEHHFSHWQRNCMLITRLICIYCSLTVKVYNTRSACLPTKILLKAIILLIF